MVPAGKGDLARIDGRWVTTHRACVTTGTGSFVLPDAASVDIAGTKSADLYMHQAQVVAAVRDGARSILLADEPGLGKTATSLVSSAAAGAQRVLVVCPAVVKVAWEREAQRWLDGARVQVLAGRKASPIAPETRVIVINYDILGSWAPTLLASGVDALIVDEAHMIKDGRAARSKAVEGLASALPAGALRMLLTGTPIPNRPIDLAHPLKVVGMLEHVGGFWAFAKRYCQAHEGDYGWDMTGADHLDELHEKLLSAGMVRRRKSDAVDLPSRTVVDVPVELTGPAARTVATAQAALVDRLADAVHAAAKRANNDRIDGEPIVVIDDALIRGVVVGSLGGGGAAFEELAALRVALGEAKALLVAQLARDLAESSKEPVVVMVHHRSVQDALAADLADLGVVRIAGGQDAQVRQAQIDHFQEGQAMVAVCSIQAAGVGITLHAASQMVLGELPWTAAAQDQAIDRIHRIGQDRPVTAWRIIAAGTLDERMAELISEKAAIGLAAIDGGVTAAGSEELGALDALVDLVVAALAQPRKRKVRKARAAKAVAA